MNQQTPSTMSSDTDRVLAKLATTQSVIESLLFGTNEKKSLDAGILKEQIEIFQNTINQLPNSYTEIGKWRIKLASFWDKYDLT